MVRYVTLMVLAFACTASYAAKQAPPLTLKVEGTTDYVLPDNWKTLNDAIKQATKAKSEGEGYKYPQPPAIKLKFTLTNATEKEVSFRIQGDSCFLELDLKGPAVAKIRPWDMMTMDYRMGQSVTLAAGKSHSWEVTSLKSGKRNMYWHYWLKPGKYTATFSQGIMQGRTRTSITADDIVINVTEPKAGKAEAQEKPDVRAEPMIRAERVRLLGKPETLQRDRRIIQTKPKLDTQVKQPLELKVEGAAKYALPEDWEKLEAKVKAAKRASEFPPVPTVDLTFTLTNTSDKAVSFWIGGDPSHLVLELKGPKPFKARPLMMMTRELRFGKQVELAPGNAHKFQLKSLKTGMRDSIYHYWLKPGKYTATFTQKVSFGRRGAVPITAKPFEIGVTEPQKADDVQNDKDEAANLNQGVKGKVEKLTGNHMPGIGIGAGRGKREPLSCPVIVFSGKVKPGEKLDKEHKQFVKQVDADKGQYQVDLPPGEYTVLAVIDGKPYLNIMTGTGHYMSVEVKKDKYTTLNIQDTSGAAF